MYKSKIFFSICLFIFLFSSSLFAQDCNGAVVVESNSSFTPTSDVSCTDTTASTCEYLIVDKNTIVGSPDSMPANDGALIVGASVTSFVPNNLELSADGCYEMVPICYNLSGVQLLLDRINDSQSCCGLVNFLSPGVCDTIQSIPITGADINNLGNVLEVMSIFGSSNISIKGFENFVDILNTNCAFIMQACDPAFDCVPYCLDTLTNENFVVPVNNALEVIEQWKVFPNPVGNDLLHVALNLKRSSLFVVSIGDMFGRRVDSELVDFTAGETTIDRFVGHLDPGVYFLVLENNEGRVARRFVVY